MPWMTNGELKNCDITDAMVSPFHRRTARALGRRERRRKGGFGLQTNRAMSSSLTWGHALSASFCVSSPGTTECWCEEKHAVQLLSGRFGGDPRTTWRVFTFILRGLFVLLSLPASGRKTRRSDEMFLSAEAPRSTVISDSVAGVPEENRKASKIVQPKARCRRGCRG